jgi:hypothetical protein
MLFEDPGARPVEAVCNVLRITSVVDKIACLRYMLGLSFRSGGELLVPHEVGESNEMALSVVCGQHTFDEISTLLESRVA